MRAGPGSPEPRPVPGAGRAGLVVRHDAAAIEHESALAARGEIEVVRERINDILAAYPGVGYLDLVPDSRLARGACILESEIGMVEASLEGQIEALRSAFQRTLGSRI